MLTADTLHVLIHMLWTIDNKQILLWYFTPNIPVQFTKKGWDEHYSTKRRISSGKIFAFGILDIFLVSPYN